ncbi:pilus biosynthesis protein TadE [Mycobacterium sp. CBMA 623]|nr:pilus biosynthesis protein TadE [Mycobacteroides sp. CBMA 326]
MSVLVLCAAGIQAVSMQARCVDASREAARLVARGDEADGRSVARRIAPRGATLEVRRDGDYVVARVTATSRLLPAVTIAAESVSALEPGS